MPLTACQREGQPALPPAAHGARGAPHPALQPGEQTPCEAHDARDDEVHRTIDRTANGSDDSPDVVGDPAKAEQVGVKKANMDVATMCALAFLAGAFIALGAVFATTVASGLLIAATETSTPTASIRSMTDCMGM